MTLIKPLRRLNWQSLPGDIARALEQTQQATEDVLAPLRSIPFLDGVLLEDIAVSTTQTEFQHKLGRAWRGWWVVKADGSVNVWNVASSDETKFLKLDASASATVSVWVF